MPVAIPFRSYPHRLQQPAFFARRAANQPGSNATNTIPLTIIVNPHSCCIDTKNHRQLTRALRSS
jgi:hypothetical protein